MGRLFQLDLVGRVASLTGGWTPAAVCPARVEEPARFATVNFFPNARPTCEKLRIDLRRATAGEGSSPARPLLVSGQGPFLQGDPPMLALDQNILPLSHPTGARPVPTATS